MLASNTNAFPPFTHFVPNKCYLLQFLLMLSHVPTLSVPQGIPTLLMAAGSFDDVLAITGFSTCLGITFSKGLSTSVLLHFIVSFMPSLRSTGSTWMNILKGLFEVVGGVVAGLILGLFLCCFPSKDQVSVHCESLDPQSWMGTDLD